MSARKRRRMIAGNWKMYKTRGESRAFFEAFLPLVSRVTDCDIVIAPPYTSLGVAVEMAKGTNVGVSAQNLDWRKEGAFTGEVSAAMLKDAGCQYVIIGHSERRQFFGETDSGVAQKTKAALDAGLIPIVCVGEMLSEREQGRTEAVLSQQFIGGPGSLTADEFSRILIAYEPVWAIGTGKVATPEIAAAAHRFLRQCAAEQYSAEAAAALRILYGGSVKPENIQGLRAQEELDGCLVGGASLVAEGFAQIVNCK